MSAILFTRYEQVWQHRSVTWGEAELEAFKQKCQHRAETAEVDFYSELYTNLFDIIKDMSIDDVIEEYDKWRTGSEDCIMIDTGAWDVPLGEMIQEELGLAADDVDEPDTDSVCDSYDEVEYCD